MMREVEEDFRFGSPKMVGLAKWLGSGHSEEVSVLSLFGFAVKKLDSCGAVSFTAISATEWRGSLLKGRSSRRALITSTAAESWM